MKYLSILGSTGSIGRQTLQVADDFADQIKPIALCAGGNRELFLAQVKKYRPFIASMAKDEDAVWLKEQLTKDAPTEIYYGREGLLAAASFAQSDIVLTAISGAAGLEPTIAAIKAGKTIALANKETLVAAGELVMHLAKEYQVDILPVDSEHCAIWQCLQGQEEHSAAKILLTASGGPFREWEKSAMEQITPHVALKHPNWQMGVKITIDSASLMNKGLEVIEARWLFNMNYDNINVVIHPQSIIHSMVEFKDGSVLAQMGVPDMRLPIQYALLYPRRLVGSAPRLKWPIGDLSFEEPDMDRFPALKLAYQAGREGNTMPAVLNAANEIAVQAFLSGKISFMAIPEVTARVMWGHTSYTYSSLAEIMAADQWARQRAEEIINNRQ